MIRYNTPYCAGLRHCFLLVLVLIMVTGCDSDSSTVESHTNERVASHETNELYISQTPQTQQSILQEENDTAIISETVILPDASIATSINFNCPSPPVVMTGLNHLFDYQWLANSEDIILAYAAAWRGATKTSELHLINLPTTVFANQPPVRLPLLYKPIMEYSPAPARLNGAQFAYISGLSDEFTPHSPDSFYSIVGPVTIYIRNGVTVQAIKSYMPPDEIPVQVKWSPDGTKLAVRVVNENKIRLEIVNLTTLESYTLVDSVNVRSFDWHPFKDLIVFEENEVASVFDLGSLFNLYIVDVVTGQLEKLTTDKKCESEPKWDPDGQRIVYTDVFDSSRDIFILDVDTREVHNVTQSQDINEFWPTWSPDGEQIAFIQRHAPGIMTDLCILALKENLQTCLTETPENEVEYLPRWSPDGRWIAYAVTNLNLSEYSIAIIEPSGSNQMTVAIFPTP